MAGDVSWNIGLYDLTRQDLWQDLDIVIKHAERQKIHIDLWPWAGPLDKQYDKWRRKFMQYQLNGEEKAYMKQFYKDLNTCERFKKIHRGARGMLTDEMVEELCKNKVVRKVVSKEEYETQLRKGK
jgi:hypothetical protein